MSHFSGTNRVTVEHMQVFGWEGLKMVYLRGIREIYCNWLSRWPQHKLFEGALYKHTHNRWYRQYLDECPRRKTICASVFLRCITILRITSYGIRKHVNAKEHRLRPCKPSYLNKTKLFRRHKNILAQLLLQCLLYFFTLYLWID